MNNNTGANIGGASFFWRASCSSRDVDILFVVLFLSVRRYFVGV